MSLEQPAGAADGEDYYEKLGVAKIINAAGTYTLFTSSIMPAPVQAAMARAAQHPVRLLDLQKAAGEYIARRLRCEAALVTSGASSAITLGTAACLSVANADAIRKIPADMAGLKNEVIVQSAHRYDYDHSLTNCGVKFAEVRTAKEYEAAFTERTVMAFFFNAALGGEISREKWVRIAHQHAIPCLNDAAADVPPISNLWTYTTMGFDLVAFSGGKGMRGPQNTGLLLGRRDLIHLASRNNSPFDETIGRGMKVAKEQIVGMVAAVDWFLSQSDETMHAEFLRRAQTIADAIRDLPSIEPSLAEGQVANRVPHLLLRYNQHRIRIAPTAVADELRKGAPSIELNPATGGKDATSGLPADENTIVVGVWMLQPGEDVIVARRLRAVLQAHVDEG
jgi:L-seryl-tRNA(Ser) seleniumtransferase